MRPLLYLESRYAWHQIAAIARSPARLSIWIPFVGSIAYLYFARGRRNGAGFTGLGLSSHQATSVAGVYLALLGITIVFAALGRVAAFRSGAEAVLFANAGIRPLTIAVWLQARKCFSSFGRWFGTLTYVFLIFAPRHVGAAATFRALLAALLALALQMSAELPIFLLARGRLRIPLVTLGGTIALLGAGCGVLSLFPAMPWSRTLAASGFDPGRAASASLHGEPYALVVFVALIGVLAIAVRLLGDDSLPELYDVSMRSLATMRARGTPAARVRFRRKGGAGNARVPAGALALIWKDWVGFRRGRGTFVLWLVGCGFWATCGFGAALAQTHFGDPTIVATLLVASATMMLVAAPLGASLGLAVDLAKPLFWLARSPLRTRVAAWTFGRAWRGAFAIALGPLVAGIVAGDVVLTVVAVPVVLAGYWSLQALGVGLYALFPNPIDSRGPMMLVRTFLTAAYVIPAALGAIVVSVAHGGPIPSALVAALVLGGEGWLVIELASARFSEHGAALATLARAT